jgi:RNA-binding protein
MATSDPPKPPPKPLSAAQTRYLRALGHGLDPVVIVGKLGLTTAVVAATKGALLAHELVKVKLPQVEPEARRSLAAALAEATRSEVAQVLGRTVLLYKRHPKKPTIVLPRPRKGAAS